MFTEAQNTALIKTELDRVFFQRFNWQTGMVGRATCTTPALFRQLDIDRGAYVEEIGVGVGLFAEVGETANVPAVVPNQMAANKATYYVKTYAGSAELSKQLFDDNMHGVWAKKVEDMALKAKATMDYTAFGVYRGAFDTTTTADGQYLCSSTHTLQGGGTTSNLINEMSALSSTSLALAIQMMQEQKDQAGVVLGNMPATLLVPPALFPTAIQLTESALVVDTTAPQNAVNVWRSQYGIAVYTSPYLGAASGGSDTAWFLLADTHSITRLFRQGVQSFLRHWGQSNNLTYNYQVNFRETYFASDYAGLIGAKGND